MGASKREYERMNYVILTDPLTELEFFERFQKPNKEIIKDWSAEPDDYNDNFKDDPVYKKLNKDYKDLKKARENYKEIIRNK